MMVRFLGEFWRRFRKDTVLLEVVEEQFPFYVNLFSIQLPRASRTPSLKEGENYPCAASCGTDDR